MKLYLINESPYMKQLLEKSCFIDNKKIEIISTKGFLLDYSIQNNKLVIKHKNDSLINYLKSIKNSIIVIGTDLDSAGDFIAFELLEFLDKSNTILRLEINFDELLKCKNSRELLQTVLKNSKDKINYTNAKRYWENFLLENEKLDYINTILTEMKNKTIKL